jgi:hypothetical protein
VFEKEENLLEFCEGTNKTEKKPYKPVSQIENE